MEDENLLHEVVQENKEGLERLAKEEPAKDRRSRLYRLKTKIRTLLNDEPEMAEVKL